ncbi:hypothetical protein Dimus_000568 [Dionaea muscipula]
MLYSKARILYANTPIGLVFLTISIIKLSFFLPFKLFWLVMVLLVRKIHCLLLYIQDKITTEVIQSEPDGSSNYEDVLAELKRLKFEANKFKKMVGGGGRLAYIFLLQFVHRML